MNKKVTLIGGGAVGTAFMYAAINKGIANEYVIIDLNKEVSKGHALDFEDAVISTVSKDATIISGDYSELKDTDILVITAGRPQKPGETRLEMVADNAKIMKSIAIEVKKSGFNGITIIASNPVDIMAHVFMEVTGFDPKKVISSGTWLDSMRLRVALAKKFDVKNTDVEAYILGEHGDSSISTLTHGTIQGKEIPSLAQEKGISYEELVEVCKGSSMKAYEIIDCKGATYWGIGASLAYIVEAVLTDSQELLPIATLLSGEYGIEGVFVGVLSKLGKDGVISTEEFKLSDTELNGFKKSTEIIKEITETALEAIK